MSAEGMRVTDPNERGTGRKGSTTLYFSAFVLLVISAAALGAGGVALVGGGSSSGWFWVSAAFSVLALGFALAALFVRRRR